jgi:hypothetical protein
MSLTDVASQEDIFHNDNFYHVHLLLYSVSTELHEVCLRAREWKARKDMQFHFLTSALSVNGDAVLLEQERRRGGAFHSPRKQKIKQAFHILSYTRMFFHLKVRVPDAVCMAFYVSSFLSHDTWDVLSSVTHKVVDRDSSVRTLAYLLNRGCIPRCSSLTLEGRKLERDTMEMIENACKKRKIMISFGQ